MAIVRTLSLDTLQADQILARADPNTRMRGRAYFTDGRARLVQAGADFATYRVRGSELYDVWLSAEFGPVIVSCSCPIEGSHDNPCKHIVASLLAFRNYLGLKSPQQAPWEAIIDRVLNNSQSTRNAVTSTFILAFSLQQRLDTWNIYAYSLPSALFTNVDVANVDLVTAAIVANRLSASAQIVKAPGNTRRFENLTDDARSAMQIMFGMGQSSYYYSSGSVSSGAIVLGRLNDIPLFVGTERSPLDQALHFARDKGKIALELDEGEGGLTLRPIAVIGESSIKLAADSVRILYNDPLWILANDLVFHVDDPGESLSPFLQSPDILIPADQQEAFLTRYLAPLAERMELRGNIQICDDVTADPVARLYLVEQGGNLLIRLRFGYGEYEVPFDRKMPSTSLQRRNGSMDLAKISRQSDFEQTHWQNLADFGLKRTDSADVFTLRAKTEAIDFLLHRIPQLTSKQFEVYGEAELTSHRVNRSRPTISFQVSSGIDWFDVDAIVQFGDIPVALKEVRRAIRRHERFVKLVDGSLGVIPDDWLERYRHIFGMTEEGESGLRLGTTQLTLIDQLMADGDSVVVDHEFEIRRLRLKAFTEITAHALPTNMNGELRAYQKSGFDWLHFLHEYEFGGCLADDMGLGKTIQALAFLQSLKELNHTTKATLLVLPRSLIFNWEREAAKWTPELRLLNHSFSDRAAAVDEFDNYDLIITTYGVLLRDISMLRKHRFHYVILDEAQAIKNPMSQTGKAARLLNADHRLTLTGTPVENSTLELWSQFAFLNPGLLGSLDYFRTEFTNAIERRQDENAASILRKLVHPFILRRTKDQVAADLPSRTERIIYTEMEDSQRKLYDKQRDYYRAQVLGMIKQDDIGDARMKILEGLLRLRQICNHPRLVEPAPRSASGKFEVLIETLETLRAEGHKALVFSQFVQMLKLVRETLDAHRIPYVYLDGRTKDRQTPVDSFQNDPSLSFFLISLKAGGVGLNLTAADYVIHIDPWWNPAVEMQATDRTHRIGQDKPVFVYKLIARDSVEEKILQLQDRKRDLVKKLISTEASFFKSLTRVDVEQLFS